ncbi:peroxiredoxin [archaeon]|nr:peroxiredoxin [archaeon]MBT6698495.1 peroxiredoxin [archaeon]
MTDTILNTNFDVKRQRFRNQNGFKKAANFKLLDKDNKEFELNKITSKYTIVYFYPRDNTPGCTIEAKNFTEKLTEFNKLDTTIFGISGGDEKSKTKFCEKHQLTITLLSDPDFKVAESYNSYGQKMFMGRTFLGIKRNTFLLNQDKEIIKVYEKVSPKKHIDQLLSDIKEME